MHYTGFSHHVAPQLGRVASNHNTIPRALEIRRKKKPRRPEPECGCLLTYGSADCYRALPRLGIAVCGRLIMAYRWRTLDAEYETLADALERDGVSLNRFGIPKSEGF